MKILKNIRNQKGISSSTVVVLIYLFIIFFGVFAAYCEDEDISLNPNDYCRITDVDYKAEVLENGCVKVTELLTYDVHAASRANGYWELWRDLCEDETDGLKVYYDVLSVNQILADGSKREYGQSSKLYWDDWDYEKGPYKWYHSKGPYNESLRNYECLLMYIPGVYREKMVFEVEYLMHNAALKYNDCSELYISMFSDKDVKYLNSFKAQILVNDTIMPDSGNYKVTTYGTNSNSFPVEESDYINDGYHTFSIDLDKDDLKFKPYNQYIEFDLISFGDDKHAFTKDAPLNNYSNDDVLEELYDEQKEYFETPNKYKDYKAFIWIGCVILVFAVFLKTKNKINRIIKANKFYTPEVNYQYFREIPSDMDPFLAAKLIFVKDKKMNPKADGYSGAMLSLVRKGYIELERINSQKGWDSNNIKIVIKKKPESALDYFSNNETSSTENNNNQSQPEFYLSKEFAGVDISKLEENQNNNNDNQENSIETEEIKEPLTSVEEKYFNLIVKYTDKLGIPEIALNSFETNLNIYYQNTQAFLRESEQAAIKEGVNNGIFQKISYDEPRKLLNGSGKACIIWGVIVGLANFAIYNTRLDLVYGGLILLAVALIGSGIYLKKISKGLILLTQEGENEYAKWKGLYNFLNSNTLINERTVVELPLWEKYLVYATAFGISEKVIKAIEVRCASVNMESSPMLNNSYYRSSSFHHHSHHVSHSIHSYGHASYSGGGTHGGYGGGGRGGGGGRRRSLKLVKEMNYT